MHNLKSRLQVFLHVMVITGELQHNLEIVDIDRKHNKYRVEA